jgi:uncharacterized protein YjbI with pentapeptide repeats
MPRKSILLSPAIYSPTVVHQPRSQLDLFPLDILAILVKYLFNNTENMAKLELIIAYYCVAIQRALPAPNDFLFFLARQNAYDGRMWIDYYRSTSFYERLEQIYAENRGSLTALELICYILTVDNIDKLQCNPITNVLLAINTTLVDFPAAREANLYLHKKLTAIKKELTADLMLNVNFVDRVLDKISEIRADCPIEDPKNVRLHHILNGIIATISYQKNTSTENRISHICEVGETCFMNLGYINLYEAHNWVNPNGRALNMCFEGANLFHANFCLTDITKSNFYGADMRYFQHGQANGRNANFTRARLQYAKLYGNYTQSNFTDTDMRQIECHEAKFLNATFVGANWEKSNIRYGDYTEATFDRASMREIQCCEAQFYRANFIGTDLRRSAIHSSFFNKVNMAGTNLSFSTFLNSTFIEAKLTNVDLTESIFNLLILERCLLLETDFFNNINELSLDLFIASLTLLIQRFSTEAVLPTDIPLLLNTIKNLEEALAISLIKRVNLLVKKQPELIDVGYKILLSAAEHGVFRLKENIKEEPQQKSLFHFFSSPQKPRLTEAQCILQNAAAKLTAQWEGKQFHRIKP